MPATRGGISAASVLPVAYVEDPFDEHRGHLSGVAYRLTGSWADAEDAVQDAWLRWSRLPASRRAAVRDERAWLTTTVARLCLDRVRSAPARRERYVGPWLPEPLVTAVDPVGSAAEDPLACLVRSEDVRLAALVVLDHLSPDQRVALVLHDVAGLPFADVADLLGCPHATARQHAVRARRILEDAREQGALPAPADHPAQRAALDAFVAALTAGDVHALAAVLHPEVEMRSDGGGVVRAARNVVRGAAKVARLLVAVAAEDPTSSAGAREVLVNGELGLLVPTTPHPTVVVLAVADGRARHVQIVLNPEKARLSPAVAPGPGSTPGR